MLSKILGTIGIVLWIIGAAFLDSEQMIIPATMAIVGILLFTAAYVLSRKRIR